MSQHPIRRVENYTNAFLTTLGVMLFMTLWVIGVTLGWVWVAATAYGIDQLFQWIGWRRKT